MTKFLICMCVVLRFGAYVNPLDYACDWGTILKTAIIENGVLITKLLYETFDFNKSGGFTLN
jgi:hypothetical protein